MKSLGYRECGCWARQWRSSSVFLGLILRRFVCKMSFYLLRVCLWFDPRLGFCGVVSAYAHCCLCVWMVAVAGSGLTAPDNGPIKGLQSWSVSSAGVSVSARHVPVLKSNYRLSWNWALGTRDRNEPSRCLKLFNHGDIRLEWWHKNHNQQAILQIYANQTAHPLGPLCWCPNFMSTYLLGIVS